MLQVALVFGIFMFLGSIHYHYGNQEHFIQYHTVAGVLGHTVDGDK